MMDISQICLDGYIIPTFQWDLKRKSTKLELSNEDLQCKAVEGAGFKSAMGDMPFLPGQRYFFEMLVDQGNFFKVGVCQEGVNMEEAFCDSDKGWGFYNGELRHGSSQMGVQYGKTNKRGDVIGVYLDMVEGTLSFGKNNERWGLAYKDIKLKTEILYAAVALIYHDDRCSLNMRSQED